MGDQFIVSVGLETHVQLLTRSKIWCGCRNDFGAEPNAQVCPVCLGYPGAMPVLNREAVKKTVLAGLMLGCTINRKSKFDRKSYFYPDMPKNYQISQYDEPLCSGGAVTIQVNGVEKVIRLTRIHLEEDVAKNNHFEQSSGVDFNRAGTPLMEIVSEPDIASADEAMAYLQALKEILLHAGVSECNLEKGQMRCDINCSIRPVGRDALGVKTEIKNMNTFKGAHRALSYEIKRQKEVLSAGGNIIQETRRWDDDTGMTHSMRTKEYAHDYRYFPEPDLLPVYLSDQEIETWSKELPELPSHRRDRFVEQYGLPEYDAGVLVADRAIADYFEAVARASNNPKASSNWVMTELLRCISEENRAVHELRITPTALASLIGLVEEGVVSQTGAKEVFAELFKSGGEAREIVDRKGLAQVSDTGALEQWVREVIAANPKTVEDYRSGKQAALQFLVGQVMRISKGKANPPMVLQALRDTLNKD